MQNQREEREMQKQKEESQRQLELRRSELEAETKRIELGSKHHADGAGPRPSYATQRPKMPPLNDPSQVDLYLEDLSAMLPHLVGMRLNGPHGYSGAGRGGTSRSPSGDRNRSTFNSKSVGRGQQFGPNSSGGSSLAASRNDVTCYQCGGKGHVRRECPSRPKEANSACSVPKLPSHCCAAKIGCDLRGKLKIESCKVFDRVSTLLRDSGCNTVGVCKSLVTPDCYNGRSMLVNTFCCKNKLFTTCVVNIQTHYFFGDVEACLLDHPIAEAILGIINDLSSESSLSFDSNSSAVFPDSSIACVVTRAQASKPSGGNELPISDTPTHFDVLAPFSDLPVRQREDPSLAPWFKRVGLPPVAGVSFWIEDGVLKRLHAKSEFATVQTTIAVPESLRQLVLSYAHESDLAGHSGFRKTLTAIRTHFSWPCARLNLALVEIGQRRSNRSRLSVNHLILLVRYHCHVIGMNIC
ncbi:scan domain-containing protein 3 [Plakobranchus ocellatus]|uniref:Scan domain-containing protein 3 n=1 Tax=Plakobranchus ocellatus TaxID=259542 RepID=A0AAV3YZL2_9GAST|nr:scan domain-containing protein 3 [Plakobranchus ocellatus]